jgi:hypothetical protein
MKAHAARRRVLDALRDMAFVAGGEGIVEQPERLGLGPGRRQSRSPPQDVREAHGPADPVAPYCEMDWLIRNWDDRLKAYVDELTAPVGTILLGRKMTDGFVSHWEIAANKPEDTEEFAFGKKMVDTPKVVFTKTLNTSSWKNTVLAKGDLRTEVDKLKKQDDEQTSSFMAARDLCPPS